MDRRSFLKAVGISPLVLVSVKAVGEVPKEVPASECYNIGIHSFPSSEIKRRLRRMVRRARIYPKNAPYFLLHLNDKDSEELFLEFKEGGVKNAEFVSGLTFYHVEIKWFCDIDMSFIAVKHPCHGYKPNQPCVAPPLTPELREFLFMKKERPLK